MNLPIAAYTRKILTLYTKKTGYSKRQRDRASFVALGRPSPPYPFARWHACVNITHHETGRRIRGASLLEHLPSQLLFHGFYEPVLLLVKSTPTISFGKNIESPSTANNRRHIIPPWEVHVSQVPWDLFPNQLLPQTTVSYAATSRVTGLSSCCVASEPTRLPSSNKVLEVSPQCSRESASTEVRHSLYSCRT